MDRIRSLAALSALAQETRLDARQNTMSANLSILRQAGLVRNRREGRRIRYFADMEGMR